MSLLLLVVACEGGPEPDPSTPPPPAAPTPSHAEHHAVGGDHMAQMAAMRDALRAELCEAYDLPVPGLEQADPARGKALYEQHCASCHGADGKGAGPAAAGLTPPPADFTDAFHARYYSEAGRVHVIRKGSPGTAMAGFAGVLSEQDVLDVYAFVRSLRPVAGAAPADGHDHGAHGH